MNPACKHGTNCDACAKDAEIKKLKEALEWCSEQIWDGFEIDSGDFQDRMTEVGLLVEVPADEAFKHDNGGDTMFSWRWSKAATKDDQ